MLWVSLMNGDMFLLRINVETFQLDLMNQVKIDEPAKKIYSLTRLSDGRMCVSQDKGFTVWQVIQQPASLMSLIQHPLPVMDEDGFVFKLVQQTTFKCFLEE